MAEEDPNSRMYMFRTGTLFDLTNMPLTQIYIEDIAHNLSRIPRFNGNTCRPISVAEHSLLVMQLVEDTGAPPPIVFQALLHDAAEAYIGDIPSPVKQMLPDIKSFEARLFRQIARKFGIHESLSPVIKDADYIALFIEARALCTTADLEQWAGYEQYRRPADQWVSRFGTMDPSSVPHPEKTEKVFIDCFTALTDATEQFYVYTTGMGEPN